MTCSVHLNDPSGSFVRAAFSWVFLLTGALAFATPPNDRCDHVLPRPLPLGGSLVFEGTTVDATFTDDAFPENEIGQLGLPVVWHAFTLSQCTRVELTYCGTAPAFTSTWGLLAKGCPAALTIAATSINDDLCGDGNRTFIYDSLGTGTFYIPVLSDVFGTAYGAYRIELKARVCTGGTPPNDLCTGVEPVTLPVGHETTFIGDNTGATFAGDGAAGTLFGTVPIPTVWHAFELTHCSAVEVSYCPTDNGQTNYWNLLATGCPAGFTIDPTQILDDQCGNGMRTLFFASLQPGVYYLPVIYDPFAGAAGPYAVQVKVGACFGGTPPNDLCESASVQQLVLGVPAVVKGDTRGATATADGTPGTVIGNSGLPTVWHAFTLDQCARVTVDYCPTELPYQSYWDLLVRDCTASDVIAPFAILNDQCASGRRTLVFDALEPGTYYLPVLNDAFNGSVGRYAIELLALNCAGEVPDNDRCTDVPVLPLAADTLVFTGNTTGATVVGDGEPGSLLDDPSVPTVWHAFTTSACSNVRITYCGTDPVFGNYWDLLFRDCPGNEPVFASDINDALCPSGARTLLFDSLHPGTYYLPVLLDPFGGSRGPYEVSVSAVYCDLQTGTEQQANAFVGPKVFPVPSDGRVTLEGLPEGAYELSVWDMGGRRLLTRSGTGVGTPHTLDLHALPAGAYVLLVEQEGRRSHHVIVLSGR
ncbi:MAG: T9SS type A sorting domain-containing protein [Flavobacteriales bacterium]